MDLYEGIDPGHQSFDVKGPGLPPYLSSIFEQSQGGDALDAELGCRGLIRFGIQFYQTHPGFETGCGLFEHRCHHFTGSAPGRPEINQHGKGCFIQMLSEMNAGQLHRFSRENRFFTLTTHRMVRKFIGRNPVDGVALGTSQGMRLIHHGLLNNQVINSN